MLCPGVSLLPLTALAAAAQLPTPPKIIYGGFMPIFVEEAGRRAGKQIR